jgi:hypothetical protein
VPHPTRCFIFDLDSTIFRRSGRHQGAAKGYNPQRSGRKRHHSRLAVLSERVRATKEAVGGNLFDVPGWQSLRHTRSGWSLLDQLT